MYRLIFTNANGKTIDFSQITDTKIINVTGLEMTKGIVSESSNPNIDGVSISHIQRDKRNVLITLAQYGASVKKIRQDIYSVLSGKQKGVLRFIDDTKDVSTTAIIEDIDPLQWTLTPTLSISILCESAFFESTTAKTTKIVSIENNLSFPLQLTAEGQEFGRIQSVSELYLENNGQEVTPCHIKLIFSGTVENPVVTNTTTGLYFSLSGSYNSGQIIDIYSDVGKKRVILTDIDGTERDLFSFVSFSSDWLSLALGQNQFMLSASSGLSNMSAEIEFKELFYGVD